MQILVIMMTIVKIAAVIFIFGLLTKVKRRYNSQRNTKTRIKREFIQDIGSQLQ